MLGYWTSHKRYVHFVISELRKLAETHPEQIREHYLAICKMLILDLDPMKADVAPLYPPTGRMAEKQMEIYRSFVLMEHVGEPLNDWVAKLENNPVLRVLAGFSEWHMPRTSSYYDFMNRIVRLDERPAIRQFKQKPKDKLGKNVKQPPKNPNITRKLADFAMHDEKRFLRLLSSRAERVLNKIFASVAVNASMRRGLISQDIDISGDGTCIETGASHYGKKVCDCKKMGIYRCECPRRFSDPNATWGWDSSKERWFYGYSGYFISTYNKTVKTDLPLYLRFVEASRHDSVSAIVSLAEFRELHPDLRVKTFISDSASDNCATYELLDHWGVSAVIALNDKNKGNFKYPPALRIDEDGRPICPGGRIMVHWGFCGKDRCRIKWRCPRVVKGLDSCDSCAGCSPSDYGRVIYTKPDWDLRLFTRIPRGSVAWKDKMKQRTAAERVNNRILNDYGISRSATRGKKRIAFMTTLAAINIHLDAQVKHLNASNPLYFEKLLGFQSLLMAA